MGATGSLSNLLNVWLLARVVEAMTASVLFLSAIGMAVAIVIGWRRGAYRLGGRRVARRGRIWAGAWLAHQTAARRLNWTNMVR